MAFLFAIFKLPIAKAIVTTAGRPSGIAAILMLTAIRRTGKNSLCWKTPIGTINAAMISMMIDRILARLSRCFCKGVLSGLTLDKVLVIWPNLVSFPILSTIKRDEPLVTSVPENTESLVFLTTDNDSPVRIDSSTSRNLWLNIFPSAEILSPSERKTMSPGTTSTASISWIFPFLITQVIVLT